MVQSGGGPHPRNARCAAPHAPAVEYDTSYSETHKSHCVDCGVFTERCAKLIREALFFPSGLTAILRHT